MGDNLTSTVHPEFGWDESQNLCLKLAVRSALFSGSPELQPRQSPINAYSYTIGSYIVFQKPGPGARQFDRQFHPTE